jgi:hypothetical protein
LSECWVYQGEFVAQGRLNDLERRLRELAGEGRTWPICTKFDLPRHLGRSEDVDRGGGRVAGVPAPPRTPAAHYGALSRPAAGQSLDEIAAAIGSGTGAVDGQGLAFEPFDIDGTNDELVAWGEKHIDTMG